MRSKFDEQLRLLNQEMMYMGTMIEDSIQSNRSIDRSECAACRKDHEFRF